MAFFELFWNHYYEIISFVVTCIITGGVTFLFYPAYIVYHHDEIEHSTAVLDECRDNGQHQNSNVLLSLVIPAYNEEDRLTVMLDECYEYLCKTECQALENLKNAYKKGHTNPPKASPPSVVEWIVVNDGSSDKTCQVFEKYVSNLKQTENTPRKFLFKLVTLPVNSGKGAAVQVGMTEATGCYRLMVDADGATTFGVGLEAVTNESVLSVARKATPIVVFGSRAGEGAKRSLLRSFLMHSFLWLRSVVVGTPVSLRDTQCGFKLFDQHSASLLFSSLHLRRWAFDIELVYVALSIGYSIKEVTVPWHEVDGSKLNTGFLALLSVSICMLRDMLCVRACYVLGIWKIDKENVLH